MTETAEEIRDLKASALEVCRICMATDITLHSLQDTHLGSCMETIGGFAKSYEGLPNYVCYQCAPILIKCNKLIDKSKATESALYDLFELNGEIQKPQIEAYKISKPHMQSSLDSYLLENYFYIRYDDENKTSNVMKVESDSDGKIIKKEEPMEEPSENDDNFEIDSVLDQIIQASKEEYDSGSEVEAIEVPVPVVELSDDEVKGADFISVKPQVNKPLQSVKGLLAHSDDVPLYHKPRLSKGIGIPKKIKPKKKKRGLAAMDCGPYDTDEKFVRRYFNINRKPTITTKKYRCKHCPESFQYVDQARDHTILGCQRGEWSASTSAGT